MNRSTAIGRVIAILGIILVLIFLAISIIRRGDCHSSASKERLILIQGRVLNAFYKDTYREIKRANSFYGYGWIDQAKVFVAYQPEDSAEAFAEVEVIDLDSQKTTKITTIGGAGESNFEVNSETKEIVFNDSDGIKMLTIKNNVFHVENIKADANAWGVFWIDGKTIGYVHYENDKEEFRTIVLQDRTQKR